MGKEAKVNEFYRGRDEGLDIAIRIIKDGGTVDDLEKEIRFRQRTGISMGLSNKELDKAASQIKALTCGTMRIALAASVADSYGFGMKRIQRVLDKFDKLTEYMDNGWLYWLDLVEELKARYSLDLGIADGTEMLRHYSRPEPEDVWEAPDLVRREEWEDILRLSGLTQGTSCNGLPCVYEGEEALIEYEGPYQQVEAYAMIQGMLLERHMQGEREKAKPVQKDGIRTQKPTGALKAKHKKRRR